MSPEAGKKWNPYERKPPLNAVMDEITNYAPKITTRDCHLIFIFIFFSKLKFTGMTIISKLT